MPKIIVIGASAGGVEALREIIRPLPANFQAALFVVMHVPAQSPSVLPNILTSAGGPKSVHPEDDERILPSHNHPPHAFIGRKTG